MSLKSLVVSNAPHRLLNTLLTPRRSFERAEQVLVRRTLGVPPLSQLDLASVKQSETLFILGSGQSIGGLTKGQFQAIESKDSLGFNFWVAHPFVPTMLLIYPGGHRDRATYQRYWSVLDEKAENYQKCLKIISDLSRDSIPFIEGLPEAFRTGLYAVERRFPFARTEAELRTEISKMVRRGKLTSHRNSLRANRLFKYGNSLSATLSLAATMEYERIILCGVDLLDRRYFYEDAEKFPLMAGYNGSSLAPAGEQHPTLTRSSPNMLTVLETVSILHEVLFKPRNVQLFVQHAESALASILPVFEEDGW